MSIPLIQKPDKDDINTSIIAIKRNIERINMLLGLSNSEEIDTSKFATKDELQQAVTDLQPVDEVTSGNMHSVSSNAVAEAIDNSIINIIGSFNVNLSANDYSNVIVHFTETLPNAYYVLSFQPVSTGSILFSVMNRDTSGFTVNVRNLNNMNLNITCNWILMCKR